MTLQSLSDHCCRGHGPASAVIPNRRGGYCHQCGWPRGVRPYPPQGHGDAAVLVTFDLIELDGEDLRRSSIEYRKRKLAKLVRKPQLGIVLNEHYEGDGEIIFKHACKLGCEGIVSKRIGSPCRSGRSRHWIKVKDPNAPAVKREDEEDWGR